MAIELFKRNEEAYNSALKMLNTIGKAAIIHPTGTGKSFIGFKLCEDYPQKSICWLSPSDYIFKTQLENLKKASGGYALSGQLHDAFSHVACLTHFSGRTVKHCS